MTRLSADPPRAAGRSDDPGTPAVRARGIEFLPALLLVVVSVLASLICLPGCTHVVVGSTPYYVDGPRQNEPSNGDLPDGTPVWVIGEKDGYTKVWASNGVIGYVWPKAIITRAQWEKIQAAQKEAEKEQQTPPPANKAPAKEGPAGS